MKIADLYEDSNEDFNEKFKKAINDILMMFDVNNVTHTNVNNIIEELRKRDFSPTKEDIIEIIEEHPQFEMDEDENVIIVQASEDELEGSEDDSEEEFEDPSTSSEDGYNPAKDTAKKAAQDRLDDYL